MAVKVSLKDRVREVEIDSVEEAAGDGGKWSRTVDAGTGRETYTSLDDSADAAVAWGAGDEQNHTDMKAGSTVETWIGDDGTRHAVVRRKL